MRVELTPRSAEIIAQEQAQNGAISPEQLIEQALAAYIGFVNPHCVATLDQLRTGVEDAWVDAEQNGSMPAEQAWQEIHKALESD